MQEISNAMRYLQGNLWELAATGIKPWQRVPNSVAIPPDVFEKYTARRRRRDGGSGRPAAARAGSNLAGDDGVYISTHSSR